MPVIATCSVNSLEAAPLVNPVVLPLGNLLTDKHTNGASNRRRTLGVLAQLDDVLIARILQALLPPDLTPAVALIAAKALSQFSQASSSTLAFAADEDLWRSIAFVLFSPPSLRLFTCSWRRTVFFLLTRQLGSSNIDRRDNDVCLDPPPFYSDVLFHKHRCRSASIQSAWLQNNDISRVPLDSLSPKLFHAHDKAHKPIILTDGLTDWPAATSWSPEQLSKDFSSETFSAGGYQFTFRDYFQYADAICDVDDQSVYLFDHMFADKAPKLAEGYRVPHIFEDDLFSLLSSRRPNYRWLIAGPSRSGSSFHKDPNATSAWNAAIYGRKKWIFFPPHSPPPGIHPSLDDSHVTAPVSVIEWFINFYDRNTILDAGGLEATVQPGEIMYVPSGWWHCVLNIDTSIAITQNFVSEVNVADVVRLFKHSPNNISGCKSIDDAQFIADNFARLVVERRPHLLQRLSFALSPPEHISLIKTRVSETDVPSSPKRRKTSGLWQSLQVSSANTKLNGRTEHPQTNKPFSFGFR